MVGLQLWLELQSQPFKIQISDPFLNSDQSRFQIPTVCEMKTSTYNTFLVVSMHNLFLKYTTLQQAQKRCILRVESPLHWRSVATKSETTKRLRGLGEVQLKPGSEQRYSAHNATRILNIFVCYSDYKFLVACVQQSSYGLISRQVRYSDLICMLIQCALFAAVLYLKLFP